MEVNVKENPELKSSYNMAHMPQERDLSEYELLHEEMDEESALTYYEDQFHAKPYADIPYHNSTANISTKRYAQNHTTTWTDDELQFLAEAYPYTSDEMLARLLNFPVMRVHAQALSLGLKRDPSMVKYRPPVVVWCNRESFDEDIEKFHLTSIRPAQGNVGRGITYRDTTRDSEDGLLAEDGKLLPEAWSWSTREVIGGDDGLNI